jgi:hypothetical protein
VRFTACAVFVAAAAALLSLPLREASAEEELKPTRYPPSSVRPKLMAGGLLVTGLAYGGAALTSTLSSDWPGSSELLIPIAGPWMSLGKSACPTSEPDCGATLYIRGFLVALDGLMQIGGLGILGEGLFMKTEVGPAPTTPPQARWIRPVPIVTATTTGFGLVGTF